MTGVRRVLPMIVAIAVGIGIAGCGSSNDKTTETVPADIARPLVATLEDAQTAAAAGECDTVKTDAQNFIDGVNEIGADQVDPAVKAKLQEAGVNLKKLAASGSDCVPTPTGPSGAQGSVEPKSPATADADATSTNDNTDEQVASKPRKPKKKATDKAKVDPKAATKAKPTAEPATPATPAKAAKDDKPPKKHGKGPKKNGPPRPKGNPNHTPTGNGSGGVAVGGN